MVVSNAGDDADFDDDDLGSLFRALNEERKRKRMKSLEEFERFGKDIIEGVVGQKFICFSPYHYGLHIGPEHTRVNYWPSSGKWEYKSQVINGTLESFCGWLRKRLREFASKPTTPTNTTQPNRSADSAQQERRHGLHHHGGTKRPQPQETGGDGRGDVSRARSDLSWQEPRGPDDPPW